jgi:hypothetical protein
MYVESNSWVDRRRIMTPGQVAQPSQSIQVDTGFVV